MLLGLLLLLPRSFITCFVTMFATVIAITKDLPDIEGDKANNIETFATRMGVKNVSLLGESMRAEGVYVSCTLFLSAAAQLCACSRAIG